MPSDVTISVGSSNVSRKHVYLDVQAEGPANK